MGIFNEENALRRWISGWYNASFEMENGFRAGYQAAVADYLGYMTGEANE